MPKTLYVHIGPRKTATKAIQEFLGKHDNSVVTYPKVGLFDPGSHHGLVFKFFGEERRGKPLKGKSIERLLDKIGQETSDSDRNVVFSSEALETRDVGAFIRGVLPFTGCQPDNVEIVLATREHFARMASWYNHRMRAPRGGEQRSPPDKYLREHIQDICYEPLVRKFRQTGFKVTVMNYHPSETWIDRFFAHIGFSGQIPQLNSRHVGLSPKALIAKLATNEAVRAKDERQKYLHAFNAMSESHATSQFIFGRDAAMETDRFFAADRKFLLDEFGISIPRPNIETQENMLFISQDELEEIEAVVQKFGLEGQDIAKIARRYLRNGPISA
jgi:hypothetical protein